MPIKATTPTSAGFAQVLDTSGIAAVAANQKAKRAKKLQDMLVEYDTKGIFTRDIPEVQRQIAATQNFAMEHSKELANPSSNMETWREFQDMQSRVKNTVTYSIGAKEQFDKANRMYHAENGKYLTEANAAALEAYSAIPTAEQYGDLTAFGDVAKDFERNTELDFENYRKIVDNAWSDTGPEGTGKKLEGTNKYIYKEGKQLDLEKLEKALMVKWEKSGLESGDLQHTYKDKGGFDAFVEDAIAMSADPTSYGLAASPAVKDADEKNVIKSRAASLKQKGSGFRGTETLSELVEGEGKDKGKFVTNSGTYLSQSEFDSKNDAIRQWNADNKDQQAKPEIRWEVEARPDERVIDASTGEVLQQDILSVNGLSTVGGSTLAIGDIPVDKPVGDAYNLGLGNLYRPGEGRFLRSQVVREVGEYKQAKKDFNIEIKDANGNKAWVLIEKDSFLPDYAAMYSKHQIDEATYDKLNDANNYRKKLGAVVTGLPQSMNYFQSPDDLDTYIKSQSAGSEQLIVPIEDVEAKMDQYFLTKFPDDPRTTRQRLADNGIGQNSGLAADMAAALED